MRRMVNKGISDLYEMTQFVSDSMPTVQIIGQRPIFEDRSTDKSRSWRFGFASVLMVGNRPMPVQGEVPGETLAEALRNLPDAMEARRQEIIKEHAAPKIVTPGVVSGRFGNG